MFIQLPVACQGFITGVEEIRRFCLSHEKHENQIHRRARDQEVSVFRREPPGLLTSFYECAASQAPCCEYTAVGARSSLAKERAETAPPIRSILASIIAARRVPPFMLAVRGSRAEARSPSIRGDDRHTPAAVMRRTWNARRSICINGPSSEPGGQSSGAHQLGTRAMRASYPIVGVSRAPSGTTPCST
jgi:hypothetical protein